MNILGYLHENIILMKNYDNKLVIFGEKDNTFKQIIDKINEIINCLNNLLSTVNDIFNEKDINENSYILYAEFFLKHLFKQQKKYIKWKL
jgi:predicted RNA-binding protein